MVLNDAYRQRLGRLLLQARTIQLSKYEQSGEDTLRSTLFPEVRSLLQEGFQTIQELEEELGHVSPEHLRESDAFAGSGVSSPQENLADLCFIALAELRPHRLQMEKPADCGSTWTCLARAERMVHSLVHALTAIESELAILAGVPATTQGLIGVHQSLGLRQACAKFRHHVRQAQSLNPNDLTLQLRSIGTAIVRLQGRQEFNYLRVTDRLMTAHLRDRILQWLRNFPKDETQGSRLIDETLVFTSLLEQVNQRQEVVEADLQELEAVAALLAGEEPFSPLPAAAQTRLQSLLGRSDALDDLVIGRGTASSVLSVVREVLQSLHADSASRNRPNRSTPSRSASAAEARRS
ncbi:MAG: hypothetical protein SX243_15815 [Acidobacteriota bacterium]|nr:hypothetical protein [Acidobacteriota bacterium]